MPTRIAFVTTDLHVGGAERCCVELATRLERSRYCAEVYSLFPPPPAGRQRLVEKLQSYNLPIHFLNATSAASLPRVIHALRQALRQQQPQIVQSFLFHANFCAAIASRGINAFKVAGIRVAEPRKMHLRLGRWVDRYVDRYVCVSQSVAQYSEKSGGLAAEKLMVIPNGIDVAEYDSLQPIGLQALEISQGRKAITFVGRLERQKGVDWLLRVAPRFLSQHPEHDLLLVGTGSERTMLENLIRRAAIENRVHFAGWRNDVPAILSASDVIVLPSRWEGMPNVVLEAMGSGKPVVAAAVEGVCELLGEHSKEQTFEPEDTDSFCQKLGALLTQSALRTKISEENHRRAATEFSFLAMAKKYGHLYTSWLAKHASR